MDGSIVNTRRKSNSNSEKKKRALCLCGDSHWCHYGSISLNVHNKRRMSHIFALIFFSVHLLGTRAIAVDEMDRSSHWFEPRTGNYVQYTQSHEHNEFEEIPLEIRLIGHTDVEDTLANRNPVKSVFHNPKIVGIILGIMMTILATFLYREQIMF